MAPRAEHKPPDSTELAALRTGMAAQRTLMAWIRTALGMISFGFSIYKFMHTFATAHEKAPRRFGIFLAALGTLSLAAGTMQYARTLHALGNRRPDFTLYVACAVIAVGVVVLVGIVLRMGPLS